MCVLVLIAVTGLAFVCAASRLAAAVDTLPKVKKAVPACEVFVPRTLRSVSLRSVVFDTDLNVQSCNAMQQLLEVVPLSNSSPKAHQFGRVKSSGCGRNPSARYLNVIQKYFPACIEVGCRNWPEVLNLRLKLEDIRVLNRGFFISVFESVMQVVADVIDADIGPFGRIVGSLGQVRNSSSQASLPERNCGIYEDCNERSERDNVILLCSGIILFAFGIVFVSRVWWNVYFNLTPDSNVAIYVALILLSAVFVWVGMALIGMRFGLVGHMRKISNPAVTGLGFGLCFSNSYGGNRVKIKRNLILLETLSDLKHRAAICPTKVHDVGRVVSSAIVKAWPVRNTKYDGNCENNVGRELGIGEIFESSMLGEVSQSYVYGLHDWRDAWEKSIAHSRILQSYLHRILAQSVPLAVSIGFCNSSDEWGWTHVRGEGRRVSRIAEYDFDGKVGSIDIPSQWSIEHYRGIDPRTLRKLQLALRDGRLLSHFGELPFHNAPLLFSVMHVIPRKYSNDYCSECGNEPIFSVKPVNRLDETMSHCFKRPHYVLGVIAVVFGLLLFIVGLGGIGRFWGEWSHFGQVAVGLLLVGAAFWCIYHGFGLIEFEVYPCPM